MSKATPAKATAKTQATTPSARSFDQTVLVLQGGGALGAYQIGVYQALHEAGIEPDWVIGTSIGAINASLIAGNKPEDRLRRLNEFWRRVESPSALSALASLPFFGPMLPNLATVANGVAGFFEPNPLAFFGANIALEPEAAGYYSTQPLGKTLGELVDFDLINSGPTRMTVGAANLHTSVMRYFDSRDETISIKHVMASGALPPAFPAVRIDGELYWDGGILSNTPVEAVFDDRIRRNSLVFAVHLWNPDGEEPQTMRDVMNRQKDMQYSSRVVAHIQRQKELHRMRHIIATLAKCLPEAEREKQEVRAMAAAGCLTTMHVVRLLAPRLDKEDQMKDIDFTASGIGRRREAGHADMQRALRRKPWEGEFDPLEGLVLHEAQIASAAAPD